MATMQAYVPVSVIDTYRARVAELEAHVGALLRAEPDSHKEALSYEGVHKNGCIWCAARAAIATNN